MSKRYKVILFIVLAVVYCFAGAFAQSRKMSVNKIVTTFPVSAETGMFLMDLEKELNVCGKNIAHFRPSAQLVERHNLQKVKEKYFVNGFVRVNSNFRPEQIQKIGGYSGKPSGKVRTVRIPLSAFPRFLKQKSITYFEISKKVYLQKGK